MSHSDGRNFFTFEGAGFNTQRMPATSSVDSSRVAPEPFNVSQSAQFVSSLYTRVVCIRYFSHVGPLVL